MQRLSYPCCRQHQREHAGLRTQVGAKQERAAAGEATMTIEVMRFLMDWLTDHIPRSDRQIGRYPAEQKRLHGR